MFYVRRILGLTSFLGVFGIVLSVTAGAVTTTVPAGSFFPRFFFSKGQLYRFRGISAISLLELLTYHLQGAVSTPVVASQALVAKDFVALAPVFIPDQTLVVHSFVVLPMALP